jgi:RNA polymerase sporulation-specific sigma factor
MVGGVIVSVDFQEIRKLGYDLQLDEDLIASFHAGNVEVLEYLIKKYTNFVRSKARAYFLMGAEREDIIQEGMIGLYKAIRDFRVDRMSSFKAFAELCITRQIITAIKTATRQKHIPLNSYVSLDKPIYDEESERTLLDVLGAPKGCDPEEVFIKQEMFSKLEETMSELLSVFERKVLTLYLDGLSYHEIAGDLNKHVKSIDNALQRVKRKLEYCIEVRDFS